MERDFLVGGGYTGSRGIFGSPMRRGFYLFLCFLWAWKTLRLPPLIPSKEPKGTSAFWGTVNPVGRQSPLVLGPAAVSMTQSYVFFKG
jgi:hypothetical protein